MFYQWLQPIRYLWQALTAERLPRDIALGAAIGMIVGLIPKGNLTAVILAMLMAALRLNLGAGLLTAFCVSTLSPHLDALTHGIGIRILDWDITERILTRWFDLPLVPWLALNNTVVLGNLLLGLVLFYPTYRISQTAATRVAPLWARWRGGAAAESVDPDLNAKPAASDEGDADDGPRTAISDAPPAVRLDPPLDTGPQLLSRESVSAPQRDAASESTADHDHAAPLPPISERSVPAAGAPLLPRLDDARAISGGAARGFSTPRPARRDVMSLEELMQAIDGSNQLPRRDVAAANSPSTADAIARQVSGESSEAEGSEADGSDTETGDKHGIEQLRGELRAGIEAELQAGRRAGPGQDEAPLFVRRSA